MKLNEKAVQEVIQEEVTEETVETTKVKTFSKKKKIVIGVVGGILLLGTGYLIKKVLGSNDPVIEAEDIPLIETVSEAALEIKDTVKE